jgi:hypothetical protein
MSVQITVTRTGVYTHDDGTTWNLPILDPYDEGIIDDTATLIETVDGVMLTYLVHDEHGGQMTDRDDLFHGWEYMVLESQRDADELSERLTDGEWRDALDNGYGFLFEKYEHGQVVYALRGESSQVDRQWDVTAVAGIMVADDDWGADTDMEQAARSTLAQFTSWCNGDVYGVVQVTHPTRGGEPVVDSCWGYIGYDHAMTALKEGQL